MYNRAGRIVSHASNGGSVSASSIYSSTVGNPLRGIDLIVDPLSANNTNLVHTLGTTTNEWFQVSFPPQEISRVVFVNVSARGVQRHDH